MRHGRFFCGLLHAIVGKFLRYRLLGASEKGWQELRRDLRHCDGRYFCFTFSDRGVHDGKVTTGKYAIENIEKTVEGSLERARLKTYL